MDIEFCLNQLAEIQAEFAAMEERRKILQQDTWYLSSFRHLYEEADLLKTRMREFLQADTGEFLFNEEAYNCIRKKYLNRIRETMNVEGYTVITLNCSLSAAMNCIKEDLQSEWTKFNKILIETRGKQVISDPENYFKI